MIYTITFNPSIDYFVSLDNLTVGRLNRSAVEFFKAGGKGINVSQVLTNLGLNNIALGFVGGFTGKKLVDLLNENNINNDMIFIENQNTRINVKISANNETEINADGIFVDEKDVDNLIIKLKDIKSDDYVVISGNISKKCSINLYKYLVEKIKALCNNIVVDCSGDLLKSVLKLEPFLVKPNLEELEQFANSELKTDYDIKQAMIKMQKCGAKNVLLSKGSDKAVFLGTDGLFYEKEPYKGKVANTIGCGDSMVAGFIYEYIKIGDTKKALNFSVAVSSASAFKTGLADKNDLKKLDLDI
jgi:1-phosphofructokinase